MKPQGDNMSEPIPFNFRPRAGAAPLKLGEFAFSDSAEPISAPARGRPR